MYRPYLHLHHSHTVVIMFWEGGSADGIEGIEGNGVLQMVLQGETFENSKT